MIQVVRNRYKILLYYFITMTYIRKAIIIQITGITQIIDIDISNSDTITKVLKCTSISSRVVHWLNNYRLTLFYNNFSDISNKVASEIGKIEINGICLLVDDNIDLDLTHFKNIYKLSLILPTNYDYNNKLKDIKEMIALRKQEMIMSSEDNNCSSTTSSDDE